MPLQPLSAIDFSSLQTGLQYNKTECYCITELIHMYFYYIQNIVGIDASEVANIILRETIFLKMI